MPHSIILEYVLTSYMGLSNGMKQYDLPIIIEQDKDGYFATCPELQGCYSQGDTYEEVVLNIQRCCYSSLKGPIRRKL